MKASTTPQPPVLIPPDAYAQRSVMAILSDGKMYSTRDLIARCALSDPRAVIRDLRNKGVKIRDVWAHNSKGVRYKYYFLEK